MRKRFGQSSPALIIAAVFLAGGGGAHLEATTLSSAAAITAPPIVHRIVNVGGIRQYVDCRGPLLPGAVPVGPTVVLVAGLGADSSYWSKVRSAIAGTARVCVYDRPGLGRSPQRPVKRIVDANVHAVELAAALSAAGERGPLVLVGHSYGGLLVRAFAIRYPTRVAAAMLLDASYASQWRGGGRYWSEPRARIDMRATERVVWGRPRLGSKPLIVMTAGIGSSRRWLDRQRAMATLSSNVEHLVVARSSHVIQVHRPSAVVMGVRALLSALRSARPLPICAQAAAAWARVGATCVR